MTDSPQTQDTFAIATNLASKVMNARSAGTGIELVDLTFLIERELDKYVEEGTMRLAKAADRR